jgi:hypothetical protein
MWEKMNKAKAAVVASILFGSLLVGVEASSAATKITNGTSCKSTQKNKTTKVKVKSGTDTYRCTTSPTASKANKKKLVWVHLDCLEGDKLYRETVAELNKAKADPASPKADIDIAQSSVDSFKTIRSLVCAKNY